MTNKTDIVKILTHTHRCIHPKTIHIVFGFGRNQCSFNELMQTMICIIASVLFSQKRFASNFNKQHIPRTVFGITTNNETIEPNRTEQHSGF